MSEASALLKVHDLPVHRAGLRQLPSGHIGAPRHAHFFGPKMASLAALATRNLTTFLAGILMASLVAGLRLMQALRLTSTSLPMPGMVKPFCACF